jgi:hypothetical protein
MTAFLPIVRSATLDGFPALCRELDLNAQALLHQVGLHPRSLLDPQTPVSAEAVQRLLEASARASGCSDFGLRLAARRSFASLGPVSLLMKGQPSVGEALQTLLGYLRLLNPSLVASLVPRGPVVVLQEELAGGGAQAAQSIELALGIMHTILRELLGPRWRPVAVHFQHAAPEVLGGHESFFGCRVRFRDGFNGIALRPADLQAQPVGGDPGLASLARQVLDGALEGTQGQVAVVRQLVMALLPGGGCTAGGPAHLAPPPGGAGAELFRVAAGTALRMGGQAFASGSAAPGRLRRLAGLFEPECVCLLVPQPVWLQCQSVAAPRRQSAVVAGPARKCLPNWEIRRPLCLKKHLLCMSAHRAQGGLLEADCGRLMPRARVSALGQEQPINFRSRPKPPLSCKTQLWWAWLTPGMSRVGRSN